MDHEVIRRLRTAMKAAGFDALVALSQDNVTYTAGFLVPSHALNRFRRTITVLAGDAFATQIVVTVEESLARQRSRISDIRVYDQFSQDPADVLANALIEVGVDAGRVGIELDYMPAQDYIRLRERLPKAEFVHCRDLYFTARMIKTDEEIALLTKVGQLTERVVGETLAEIRPGMTEKAVAQVVADRMMNGGCDGLKCQVGSGIRSSSRKRGHSRCKGRACANLNVQRGGLRIRLVLGASPQRHVFSRGVARSDSEEGHRSICAG